MAWELSVRHIDLGKSTGDATLIVARTTAAHPDHPITRSVLIDGGRVGALPVLRNVLNAAGLAALDAIVATHYDADHLGGLRALLGTGSALLINTRIYDQGEPGTPRPTASGGGEKRARTAGVTFDGREDDYVRYLDAIATRATRVRVTRQVLAFQPVTPLLAELGYVGGDNLITTNTDVLWDGYANPLPDGRPTLICVAANQFVRQAGGAPVMLASGLLTAPDNLMNARSLAFLLTFGNFKYYVGGDIEAHQEDGSDWNGAGYTVNAGHRAQSLMRILNPTNDPAGRVQAMKTSHHGSKYSSSPAFLGRLRPRAAFISCGTDNQFGHPDQEVVDGLEAVGCHYYLTGERLPGPTRLGARATVAGVWPPSGAMVEAGHIELRVTAAQAAAVAPAFTVSFTGPNAGTNIAQKDDFAYRPFNHWTTTFP